VALTRAVHRCYVIWDEPARGGETAMKHLLNGERMGEEKNFPSGLPVLKELVRKSGGALGLAPPPIPDTATLTAGKELETPVTVRRPRRRVSIPWHLSSFSALTAGTHPPLLGSFGEKKEELLPRGTLFGLLLHRVLELVDFADLKEERGRRVLEKLLERYEPVTGQSRGELTDAVQQLLVNSVTTPLEESGKLTLETIPRSERITEMEFFFPVGGKELQRLPELLAQHLPPQLGAAARALRPEVTRGLLQGSIDLVFTWQGKWYLADYKSNLLADYRPAGLAEAMVQHHYYLQELIYTLALHKYLDLRLPGYRYEEHFGGAFYLFLRGLKPEAGPGSGVWFHHPAPELVHDLEQLWMEQA
jgi:exodeoxyribonuclease V beta subunit